MTKLEELLYLNECLIAEMPQYRKECDGFSKEYDSQRKLFRSLLNVRPPLPLDEKFLVAQDRFLQAERTEVVSLGDLSPVEGNLYLWRGDITTLEVDSIVNAANSALLGCFIPCHRCIDNAIHSAAGAQLREACHQLIEAQGGEEETGLAKMTEGYNLPAKYVIHTVGPIVSGKLTEELCGLLESCYESCLSLAIEKSLDSIAFCCISTGEFHFPNDKASEIAVSTVKRVLSEKKSEIKVVFNVFTELDEKLYRGLLG